MNHKHLFTLFTLLLVTLETTPTLAAATSLDNEEPIKWSGFERHWYYGAEIGIQYLPSGIEGSNFDTVTGKGFIGYELKPYIAIETNVAGYQETRELHVNKFDDRTEITKIVTDFSPEVDLLAKTTLRITDEIILFAKLGIGFWNETIVDKKEIVRCEEIEKVPGESSKKVTAFLVSAVGMNFRFTDSLSIDAAVYYSRHNTIGHSYIPTIGFTYHAI